MTSKIIVSLMSVVGVFAAAACAGSTTLNEELNDVTGQEEVAEEKAEPIQKMVEKWDCPGCNPNERYVLSKLQDYTKITDRNALSTLMGNIKSESNFHPNICEGGARVAYHQCHSGGYGLIQWTTQSRYDNLGKFCRNFDCDPSSLEGQTRFMVNEVHFQKVLPEFEGSGWSIRQYMAPAYYWLGWGIKGYRESYAHDYYAKMEKVTVPLTEG